MSCICCYFWDYTLINQLEFFTSKCYFGSMGSFLHRQAGISLICFSYRFVFTCYCSYQTGPYSKIRSFWLILITFLFSNVSCLSRFLRNQFSFISTAMLGILFHTPAKGKGPSFKSSYITYKSADLKLLMIKFLLATRTVYTTLNFISR